MEVFWEICLATGMWISNKHWSKVLFFPNKPLSSKQYYEYIFLKEGLWTFFPAQWRLPFALCNNYEIVLLVWLLTVDNRIDLKVWNLAELWWYCLFSARVVSSHSYICVVRRSVTFLYNSEPEIEPTITKHCLIKRRGTNMYAISGSG